MPANTHITSLRQLDEHLKKTKVAKEKQLTRNNAYVMPLEYFHVQEGFNLRELNQEHVEMFASAFKQGLYVPPLVVEVMSIDGQFRVVLRDGHHRFAGAKKAMEAGVALPGLQVTQFKGNSADAVVLMMNSSEGLPLKPMQRAEGYKRLSGQGWSAAVIAERVSKSVTHVNQLLALAYTEENVKQLINDGKVTPSAAFEVVQALKGSPEAIYTKLTEMVDSAASEGRVRASAGDASKALNKVRFTPKETKAAFGMLASVTDALRTQLKTSGTDGQTIVVPLELEADRATELLALLDKFNSTQKTA